LNGVHGNLIDFPVGGNNDILSILFIVIDIGRAAVLVENLRVEVLLFLIPEERNQIPFAFPVADDNRRAAAEASSVDGVGEFCLLAVLVNPFKAAVLVPVYVDIFPVEG